MDMQRIEMEIPGNVLASMHKTKEELIRQMKTLTAINLYLSKELSLELAAEFSGKPKWEFESLLAKNKIPISLLQYDDYQKELDIISNL